MGQNNISYESIDCPFERLTSLKISATCFTLRPTAPHLVNHLRSSQCTPRSTLPMDTTKMLQVAGISGAFALSGVYFCSSQVFLPTMYELSPETVTKMFARVFYRGTAVVAPLSMLSAVATGTLSYMYPEQRNIFAAATAATVAPLIWTRVVMGTTVNQLLELGNNAAMREKAGSTEIVALLKSWTAMNFVRSGLGAAGGFIALWAVLAPTQGSRVGASL